NEELDAAIKRWLPDYEPDGQSPGDGAGSEAEPGREDVAEVLDQAPILQLRETLTPEMRANLTRTFEESLSKCLADMASAVRRGDQTELRRLAHLLGGSGAILGVTRLKLACR